MVPQMDISQSLTPSEAGYVGAAMSVGNRHGDSVILDCIASSRDTKFRYVTYQ